MIRSLLVSGFLDDARLTRLLGEIAEIAEFTGAGETLAIVFDSEGGSTSATVAFLEVLLENNSTRTLLAQYPGPLTLVVGCAEHAIRAHRTRCPACGRPGCAGRQRCKPLRHKNPWDSKKRSNIRRSGRLDSCPIFDLERRSD